MKTLNLWIVCLLLLTVSCNANTKKETAALEDSAPKNSIKANFIEPQTNTIKVALLLDTSNSMDGLIHQAKAQLWEIINELSYAKCEHEKPQLEIALYEYGNDNLPASEGHIRQVLAFSNDLDEISEKLFSLTTKGGNEFCGTVIQTSLNQLEWGNNTKDLKLMFIAGNEPFTQGKLHYKDAITNANEKDVVVNTIFCGSYDQGISGMWKDGAALGKGEYMTINHNKAIAHIKTPYDDAIMQNNKKLNGTYLAYGRQGNYKYSQQATQDQNAGSINEEIAVKRAISKSSHLYKNSSWDLVDGYTNGKVDLDKIKAEELPKELKNKSKEEVKSYVLNKKKEREAIQKEIRELNKKRTQYIKENKKKGNETDLEDAMIKAIKNQASKKNYKW